MTGRKSWWRDVLSGAATLMDIAGTGSRGQRQLRRQSVPAVWAVTDRNLGPAWADQAVIGVPPPAAVAAAYAAWVQDQERAGGVPERDRARILVTVQDARHAYGHALLFPGSINPLWAEAVERVTNAR